MRISSGFFVLLVEFAALFDTSCLSAEFAEIVELCSANSSLANEFDFVDARAVCREDSLHTNSVRYFADDEVLADSAVLAADHYAFEYLDT